MAGKGWWWNWRSRVKETLWNGWRSICCCSSSCSCSCSRCCCCCCCCWCCCCCCGGGRRRYFLSWLFDIFHAITGRISISYNFMGQSKLPSDAPASSFKPLPHQRVGKSMQTHFPLIPYVFTKTGWCSVRCCNMANHLPKARSASRCEKQWGLGPGDRKCIYLIIMHIQTQELTYYIWYIIRYLNMVIYREGSGLFFC